MANIDPLNALGIIFTILSFGAAAFFSLAMATKKFRDSVIKEMKGRSFGSAGIEQLAHTWVMVFEHYFGTRFLSLRQLLTIPIYTLLVSCLYIVLWFFFNNYMGEGETFGYSSPILRQALYDYFHRGIFIALIVDTLSISLSRLAIKTGKQNGYLSFRFFFLFLITASLSFLFFTLGLYFLRVFDMVQLYLTVAPFDEIPVIPYKPFEGVSILFKLFDLPTVIHVTSVGLYSTYFIPEPVLFYAALTSQLSFVFLVFSHLLAKLLLFVKQASIKTLQTAGTATGAANGIFTAMLLWMLAIVLFFVFIAFY